MQLREKVTTPEKLEQSEFADNQGSQGAIRVSSNVKGNIGING